MRRGWMAIAWIGVFAASAAAGDLRVDGRWFKDADGRVVILRGVNVAGNSKVPPFTPIDAAELLDPLADWGMNAIRFLFTWEAFEPAPGVYDESYLDYYAQAVDWAWERGIRTIVDIHQDSFSRFTNQGCGEGFPRWAVASDVPTVEPDNSPENCEDWGVQMIFDIPMHLAWNRFYADTEGARTRYLAMVARIAERLGGHPGVAGIDLINEPWGYEDTEILGLYEDAEPVVRAEAPDWILFVSPHALASGGFPTRMNRPSFANFAFAPHFYDGSIFLFNAWLGTSVDLPFARMNAKAAEWGVPMLLGEYGASPTAGNARAYVDELYSQLDKALASGTQWVYTPGWDPALKDGWNGEDFSIVDDTGATRANFRVRPFPRAVAGEPTAIRATYKAFLRANSIEVEWMHDPALGETEIFAPKSVLFPDGMTFTQTEGDDLACAYDAAERFIHCTSGVAGPKRFKIRGCVELFGLCL